MAGGLVATSAAPSAAATPWSPRQLKASELKVGDLTVGPDATVVRIATRTTLGNGRVRLSYNHPRTGAPVAFEAATASAGYRADERFVVLARGVSAAAVRFDVVDEAPPSVEIDGGGP